jgi:hypothetical protein
MAAAIVATAILAGFLFPEKLLYQKINGESQDEKS